LLLNWRGTQAVLGARPRVAECINSNCFVWNHFTGWVFRQSTESSRSPAAARQGPAGPALWAREGFPLRRLLSKRQQAAREMLPAQQHLSTLPDIPKLVWGVFSHPEAIY